MSKNRHQVSTLTRHFQLRPAANFRRTLPARCPRFQRVPVRSGEHTRPSRVLTGALAGQFPTYANTRRTPNSGRILALPPDRGSVTRSNPRQPGPVSMTFKCRNIHSPGPAGRHICRNRTHLISSRSPSDAERVAGGRLRGSPSWGAVRGCAPELASPSIFICLPRVLPYDTPALTPHAFYFTTDKYTEF